LDQALDEFPESNHGTFDVRARSRHGAPAQLELPSNVLQQQEANIAAGYAYLLGYILTWLTCLLTPREFHGPLPLVG
jgi:hypothetical protein